MVIVPGRSNQIAGTVANDRIPDSSERGQNQLGQFPLAGFSSGLTEMVYLGKAWTDPAARSNKRIQFFEEAGFDEAAEAYRAFSYPSGLSDDQQKIYRQLAGIRPDWTRDQLESYIRSADAQRTLSAAIVKGENAESALPPLLAHRGAWQAYVNYCVKAELGDTPPEWLMSEFLEPLGFDQAVVRGLREDF